MKQMLISEAFYFIQNAIKIYSQNELGYYKGRILVWKSYKSFKQGPNILLF